ncbi:MAG: glycosyltransferase family 4 protein [Flavobacteriaceae bacterium]
MVTKKALIYDWYTVYGGAERCNESFNTIWPDLENFALIDFLDTAQRESILKGKAVNTSFIQKLPFAKKHYRKYLPFFPYAIEQFDLNDYELVLSCSSCVSKGVLTNHDQLHISYVLSPVRYAWDLYAQYLTESNLNKGIKGFFAKLILHYIRIWDLATSNRPDYYITLSNYVAKRIKKLYGKDSIVIYPPVDVGAFTISDTTSDYFITSSRMVPYKKMDLIVEAFSQTSHKLIVIGDGPDMKKVKSKASSNITIMGYVERDEMIALTQNAKAFIFAAEEDFGIAPVEAQACGVPVIAFGKGGALETIKGKFPEEQISKTSTGVFFHKQSVASLLEGLNFFIENEEKFDKATIRENAKRFSTERFEKEIKETVEQLYYNWNSKK